MSDKTAQTGLREVSVPPLDPRRFKTLLDEPSWLEFDGGLEEARHLLQGRVVWNVNSTAAGGGVAEMLRSFVSYSRGAGLDMRWVVIGGNPDFFRVTKRIHNLLHGAPGDGGALGPDESAVYASVSSENAEQLAAVVRPEDVVILHDPQTAGLAKHLKDAHRPLIIWRSHVGAEEPNELVHTAWDFLASELEAADVCIFSRRAYVPPWLTGVRTEVIQPSIDPFSPKNQDMDVKAVRAILGHVGLVVGELPAARVPTFARARWKPRAGGSSMRGSWDRPTSGFRDPIGGTDFPLGPAEGSDRSDARLCRAHRR